MNSSNPQSPRLAGGFFMAAGMLSGAIIGLVYRQGPLGMVLGLGLGTVVALIIWLIDRKRG